jgi:hypothetical protein
MNENIEDNDWKNEAPTLAAMSRRNPFAVPGEYFEQCHENISAAIFMEGLKNKTTHNSFEVPLGYFEDLSERIETRITISELPKATHNFDVPAGYFDNLQDRINAKIGVAEPKKEAKVVPLWKRGMVKYASAACFLLVSTFGIYVYQNNQNTDTQLHASDIASDQMLYDIDENTIIEHLETQEATVLKTNSASDTEMENYILNNFSSNDLTQEFNN